MSIELQIQSSVLQTFAARTVQARLRTACFGPLGPIYIDHVDLGAAPVALVAAGAAVRLRVPIDIFVVQRAAVVAAPNSVPAGVTAPAGTVVAVLELAASGAVVSLQVVDVELGALATTLGPAAAGAKNVILGAIGSPATTNLTNLLNQLGLPVPTSSRIELVGSIVAVRLDPVGPGAGHLFPGHEWGLFMDGRSVEQLALSMLPLGRVRSVVPFLQVGAHWRPAGDVPHVDIDYAGKVPVDDPFTASVDGTVGVDLSLVPTATSFLRAAVQWSMHVDLGDLVPGFIEDIVEKALGHAFDPTTFGGTPTGDRTFTLDSPLPDIPFGGARLNYASVLASAAGMTIGGPVQLPRDPGKDTLHSSGYAFGHPYRLEFCSILAKTGSGSPSKTVSLSEVTTRALVLLEACGAVCGIEIVSPGNWIKDHMAAPADHSVGESQRITIVIPSAKALGITQPVRLIVRTARGVRLFDLGVPPPAEVDVNGNVTNALKDFIDDCLKIPVGESDAHGVNWRNAGKLDRDVIDPPLEHPDWATYLASQRGIEVQLVTLSGLEPGELIRFRSHDHAVDVTADRRGGAMVPVFLRLSNDQEAASLVRVNRSSISGHLDVRTAAFARQAELDAGKQRRLSLVDGRVRLTTQFDDHIDIHEIGQLGAPVLLRSDTIPRPASRGSAEAAGAKNPGVAGVDIPTPHGSHAAGVPILPSHAEVLLNPQPLPPRGQAAVGQNPLLSGEIKLPGMVSIVAVPGFEETPIALAMMSDGAKLILGVNEDGRFRVAGTFAGPVGPIETAGSWGVAVNAGRAAIFRVTRG